jgi:hypothetical protein
MLRAAPRKFRGNITPATWLALDGPGVRDGAKIACFTATDEGLNQSYWT